MFDYENILARFYPAGSPEYRKYRDDFVELARNYAIYDAESAGSLHLAGQLLTILESAEEIAVKAGSAVTSITQLSFLEESGDMAEIVTKSIENSLSEMEII